MTDGSTTAGTNADRISRSRWLGVLALVVAGGLTLPVVFYPMPAGGEFTYQAGMILALREHLQWGSQLMWTYGPYGYLNEPAFMDFNSWLPAFVANVAGHLAFFAVLAIFLWRIKAPAWMFLMVAAVILLSFDRYKGFEFERFADLDHKAALTAVLLLFLATGTSSPKTASIFSGGAGLVIGFLFLDKGTFLLAGTALVAVFLALSLRPRQIGPSAALLGGLLAGFLGLWLLAGQSITGIPSYFRTSYEIIAGYTPAMSWFLETGALHPTVQLGIALEMLIAAGLSLLVTMWRRDWHLFRLVLLTSPVMFFVFKNSFVRFEEGRAVEFWALAAVLGAFVLAGAVGQPGGSKRQAPLVLAGITVAASLALVGGLAPMLGGFPQMRPALAFPDNLAGYGDAISLIVSPDRRVEEEAQVRRSFQAAYPLPPDVVDQLRQGTFDAPSYTQMVIAYGFKWDPQPVLMSYNAWRPYLDHADAQHYLSADAPRFVVFTSDDIDTRYALFDQPEAYRALMQRYRVVQDMSNLLILERGPDAPLPPERPAGNLTGRLNDWIAVPPHGDRRLYGRIRIEYSLLGQILTLFNRPPELHIVFQYAGGKLSPPYRFIPANAQDGLDLSGYAPDTTSVGHLAAGQFDQPVEAILIEADSPASAYAQDVQVTFFTQPVT